MRGVVASDVGALKLILKNEVYSDHAVSHPLDVGRLIVVRVYKNGCASWTHAKA